MLNIGIIDDGVGIFPTLNKLKQVVSANFVCKILDDKLPLGEKKGCELFQIGKDAVDSMEELGCDAVVLSSISLSACCYRHLINSCSVSLFASEAPVMHSATYTASKVLVVGDRYVTKRLNMPNVIPCCLSEFPYLAETADERAIVRYINDTLDGYGGAFDCIALASSCMNMYRSCFARVFPNVQIFDSLEGVARKIRKKYKKTVKEESSFVFIDGKNRNIAEKYAYFIE